VASLLLLLLGLGHIQPSLFKIGYKMDEKFTRINRSKYSANHVVAVQYAGQYVTMFMAEK